MPANPIPITNTKGESAAPLIRQLTRENIKLNVTALMTVEQVPHHHDHS